MYTLQDYDPAITQNVYFAQGLEIGTNRDATSLITSNALTVNGNIHSRHNLRVDGLLSVTGQSTFTGNIVGNVKHSGGTFISPCIGTQNVVQYLQGAFSVNQLLGSWTTPTTTGSIVALLFIRVSYFANATGLRTHLYGLKTVVSGVETQQEEITMKHYFNTTGWHYPLSMTHPVTLQSNTLYRFYLNGTGATSDGNDFFSLSIAYLGSAT